MRILFFQFCISRACFPLLKTTIPLRELGRTSRKWLRPPVHLVPLHHRLHLLPLRQILFRGLGHREGWQWVTARSFTDLPPVMCTYLSFRLVGFFVCFVHAEILLISFGSFPSPACGGKSFDHLTKQTRKKKEIRMDKKNDNIPAHVLRLVFAVVWSDCDEEREREQLNSKWMIFHRRWRRRKESASKKADVDWESSYTLSLNIPWRHNFEMGFSRGRKRLRRTNRK